MTHKPGKTTYVPNNPDSEYPGNYWYRTDFIEDEFQTECITAKGLSEEEVNRQMEEKIKKWEMELNLSPLKRLKNLAKKEHILDHDKEIMLKLITQLLSEL